MIAGLDDDVSSMVVTVSPREAQVLSLRDGRALGFGEWGDAGGIPAFFFHGTPGSRILARVFEGPALAMGIRLIGVDRPGYGLSAPMENRTVLDFAADIEQLANSLELDQFGVMGASGGSPYVLACAHRFPERVLGAVVLCGIGPPESWDGSTREILDQAAANPALSEASLNQFVATVESNRDDVINMVIQNAPESLRSVAESKPEIAAAYIDHSLEALRQGTAGTLTEQQLVMQPWGFDLGAIKAPVRIWCGSNDALLPHAHWMHQKLTDSKLRVDDGLGHIDGLWIAPELIDMFLDCLDS